MIISNSLLALSCNTLCSLKRLYMVRRSRTTTRAGTWLRRSATAATRPSNTVSAARSSWRTRSRASRCACTLSPEWASRPFYRQVAGSPPADFAEGLHIVAETADTPAMRAAEQAFLGWVRQLQDDLYGDAMDGCTVFVVMGADYIEGKEIIVTWEDIGFPPDE